MKSWGLIVMSMFFSAQAIHFALAQKPLHLIITHILAAALGYSAALALQPDRRGLGIFEIFMAFAIPCLGGFITWTYVLSRYGKEDETVIEDFTHYIDATERLHENFLETSATSSIPNPEEMESLADIIKSDAENNEKRLAIEALAQLETPQAVEILRDTLSTSNVEVRFYAASVLSRLEERLSLRLTNLEEDLALGRRTDPAARLELARSVFDFVYYGLADGERRKDVLENALYHTREALGHGLGTDAYLLEGRILLAMNRYREAAESFTRYLNGNRNSQAGYLWRAEAYFQAGFFAELRRDCQAAMDIGPLPRQMKEAILLWN